MRDTDRGPTVVIGLPTHNGDGQIDSTIESIVAQSYKDFVLLISDNASTDRTPEICRDWANKDPRIRVIRCNTKLGMIANFRQALACAPPAQYFKWHADDDLLEPTYLEKTVAFLEQNPTAVGCHSQTMGIDGVGRPIDLLVSQQPGVESSSPVKRLGAIVADPNAYLFFLACFALTPSVP